MNGEGPTGRGRLSLASGLAGALAIGVAAVVALAGSGEGHEFSRAPSRCISAWNEDPAALSFGRHQSGTHRYREVQVMTLSADGSHQVPPGSPGAACTVVFAASALDPEPISAAQVLKRATWLPLSRLAGLDRLAAMQARAQAGYNARLTPEGTLEPL